MKTYFKSSLLFIAVISASLFMIMESGEYYQKFYDNRYQGYWAAFLVESFLAIAAMLHFKGKKTLNILIKLMMIPLFLVVVAGASLKVVTPLVNELAQIKSNNRLINGLNFENHQTLRNLELLNGQKINTALEVKRQRQSTSELKETLKSQSNFEWMIWIVIGFSTILRLSIQVANLVFAHSLGVIRTQEKQEKKQTELEPKTIPDRKPDKSFRILKCKKLIQYLEKNR